MGANDITILLWISVTPGCFSCLYRNILSVNNIFVCLWFCSRNKFQTEVDNVSLGNRNVKSYLHKAIVKNLCY
ncbi:unnamed protein product [Adineta ricciae]|uniref:Uncharacterized protein n=1 Tax=Adineta ricciae TaxID=249248 RepID=A0A815AJ54_ADIRI|nr:unnamed protein product [Adineta ricciae]